MILHGIEAPNIIHINTVAENFSDIQEKTALTLCWQIFRLAARRTDGCLF
jgi:hypothetical protein